MRDHRGLAPTAPFAKSFWFAFPSVIEPVGLKSRSLLGACAGVPGSGEIKATVSGFTLPWSLPCALSGAQETPQEKFLTAQSQGAESILPAFTAPLPCRDTSQREPAAVPLQPRRASLKAEETFLTAETHQAEVPSPRSTTAIGIEGLQGGMGEGEREGRHGKGEGGWGPVPPPVPCSRTAAGKYIWMQDTRTRAEPAPPCHRDRRPESRASPRRPGLPGQVRGQAEGSSGGVEGREEGVFPRGVTGWPLALGHVRGAGVSQSARYCHPTPDRPFASAVTTARPLGSFIPAAIPTQTPQHRQRDAQTESHVGTVRPFQRVLTSPALPSPHACSPFTSP